MGVVPLPFPPCTYTTPSGDVGVRESYTTMPPYAHRVSRGPYTYSPIASLPPWRCRCLCAVHGPGAYLNRDDGRSDGRLSVRPRARGGQILGVLGCFEGTYVGAYMRSCALHLTAPTWPGGGGAGPMGALARGLVPDSFISARRYTRRYVRYSRQTDAVTKGGNIRGHETPHNRPPVPGTRGLCPLNPNHAQTSTTA